MSANQPTKRSRKQDARDARKARQEQALKQEAQRRKQLTLLGIIAGIAIVGAFVLILINRDGDDSGLPAIVAAPAPLTVERAGLTIGNPNAPVQIIEYGDYQCPYCADFTKNGFGPMLDEFIATGKVHFTYVPMSFLGDESVTAAEAALCANDQGMFWEMHESIYANHFGENRGAYSRSRLDKMAEGIGLDMDAFKSCMNNGDQRDAVAQYAAQAQAAGITSTPRLVINGQEPIGWTNWAAFKAAIEAELNK